MSDSEQHPIARELMSDSFRSNIEKRAVYAVVRAIAFAKHLEGIRASQTHGIYSDRKKIYDWEPIKDLDYEGFKQELSKPDGGIVGKVRGLGKMGLDALRKRCLGTSQEYGYA